MANPPGPDDLEDSSFVVERLLSEGWIVGRDGRETLMYLIKWEGYELRESKKSTVDPPPLCCTWEPPQNLRGTNFLREWADERWRIGDAAFHEKNAKNEAEYEAVLRQYEESRKPKRADHDKIENHSRLEEQLPVAASDSDDDTPLILQNRSTEERVISPKSMLARREARDASQLNSLFQDSQDVQSSPFKTPRREIDTGLFVRGTPVPRRPPLLQSGSSSSESEAEEDPMVIDGPQIGGTQKAAQKKKSKHTAAAQSLKDPAKPPLDTTKTTKVTKPGERKVQQSIEVPKPSVSSLNPVIRDKERNIPGQKTNSPVEKNPQAPTLALRNVSSVPSKASSNAKSSNAAAASSSTSINTFNAPISAPANRPSNSSALRSIVLSATTPQASSGTRIVNQPKTKLRQWQHGDSPFPTLHARHVANLRSRAEGTPELGVLEFPGGAPAGLPKPKSRAPVDNPYGRREAGAQRAREQDPDDNLGRKSVGTGVLLENWEAEKIRLVCPDYRLSNNCPFTAEKCRYMHRDKDPMGNDYPVGDPNGWLPPKYRKPALTCPYWLGTWGHSGCNKSEEECTYAHRNTEWMPMFDRRDEPMRIDSVMARMDDETRRRRSQPNVAPVVKPKLAASELTCWYWKNNTCRRTAESCQFQHYDTGHVAPEPGRAPVRAITCHFWANGDRCMKSAEECKFQHFHTGIVSGQPDKSRFAMAPSVPESPSDQSWQPAFPMSDVRSDSGTEDLDQSNAKDDRMVQTPKTQMQQLATLPPPTKQRAAKMSCSQLREKIGALSKLNFSDVFVSNSADGGTSLVNRRAFLIYHPEEHPEELDLITRWLLMHHVEVGNAWYDGSWDNFSQQILKGGSGVIIAHPEFEFFTELPDLGRVLQKQVRLWSVGTQEGIEYDPALTGSAPEVRNDCIEIFPLGGLIYITDDVFEKKPQLALRIVKLFFKKIENLQQLSGPTSPWHEVSDATLLWRVCVRPELMEYLLQRCEVYAKQLDAGDADIKSVAELYKVLSETNYIEQDDPATPLSLIPDRYPILSERRVVAGSQPVDYFNTRKRSQEEANLHMIRYYAGLQVDMRRDYRHFYVIHADSGAPCVQRWKQEIQTIAEVLTPESCIAELTKEGKGSLFDFCERYMSERKGT